MRRLWTEDELIKSLKLYCELPFGRLHSKNPEIISLAQMMGRTPSSVALKMVNFASLDPTIKQKGMKKYSKLDKEIWEIFFSNIDLFLSEEDVFLKGKNDTERVSEKHQEIFMEKSLGEGKDYSSLGTTRSGQQKFRNAVMASYDGRCAVSGISDSRLLVASHIAPWATHPKRRLDPRNGICLNALLDKAFDTGTISLSDDFELLVQDSISSTDVSKLFAAGRRFRIPQKFAPDLVLIQEHRKRFGFV